MVEKYLDETSGAIAPALQYVPPCAPERNPVEHLWAYQRIVTMPNLCVGDCGQWRHHASSGPRSMQRRKDLDGILQQHAKLF